MKYLRVDEYIKWSKIILVFFILANIPCYSQLVNYTPYRDFNENKFAPYFTGFVRKSNNIIFHLDVSNDETARKIVIEKITDDGNIIYKKELSAEKNEREKELLIGKDRIFIFTTLFDGAIKQLYLTVVNEENGEIIAPKRVIASLQSDKHGLDGRKYFASISPDKTKILIVSAFQWVKKAQVVRGDIYDATSMNLLNTMQFPDKYNDKLIKTRNYIVTDNGSVFFKANPDNEEIVPYMRMPFSTEDATLQEQLDLLNTPPLGVFGLWNSNDKFFQFIDLPVQNKKIVNAQFLIKDGVFSYFGLFEDSSFDKDLKARNGIFNMSVDFNNLNVINTDFNYFSEQIISKIYPDGRKKAALKIISLDKLLPFENGSYLIETMTDLNAPVTSDLIITKFDLIGKVEFTRIIPKRTAQEADGYDYIISNNDLYLLYCDSPDNISRFSLESYDPKQYKRISKVSGAQTVCVKISSNGDLMRQIVFINDSWNYDPGRFSLRDHINKDEVIIRMMQNNNYQYYTIRVLK